MKSIAVIPARGGSKRIPMKNIKNFSGKPAIAYPIELTLNTGIFDKVIVTTDSQEIAEIASHYGAEVPFLRRANLSDDYTTTVEVISDLTFRLELEQSAVICCVYPVTPLLQEKRVTEAYELFQDKDYDYVFLATEASSAVERSFRKNLDGRVDFLYPEHVLTRTQDLDKSYFDAGQLYIGQVKSWRSQTPILGTNSSFITLDKYETVDIDDDTDWRLAEVLFEMRQKKTKD